MAKRQKKYSSSSSSLFFGTNISTFAVKITIVYNIIFLFSLRSSQGFVGTNNNIIRFVSTRGRRCGINNNKYYYSFFKSTTRTIMSSSSNNEYEINNNEHRYVDIGANLLDERFTQGVYNGKQRHEPDWDAIVKRATKAGVTHIILTAGTLQESRKAIEMVRSLRQTESNNTITWGCTIGIHPTRCLQEFVNRSDGLSDQDVLQELQALIQDGKADKCVMAIGEMGLDYDRLEFCPKEIQIQYFQQQLDHLCTNHADLPMFLHNRNVGLDLVNILQKYKNNIHAPIRGVVHSFDDTIQVANAIFDIGENLFIGLNGCSLKTNDNLQVVKELPCERLLLETDCPYCEVKAAHAGYQYLQTIFEKKVDKKFELGKLVKGRNEPCQIVHVAEIIAGIKNISVQQVANACYENSFKLYQF